MEKSLEGEIVFISGSARRIGHYLALAAAKLGADIIIHHGHSPEEAQKTAEIIESSGSKAWIIQADLSHPQEALEDIKQFWQEKSPNAIVNNAAIFETSNFLNTTLQSWEIHLKINLTFPFLLSQAFAEERNGKPGRIINILDWRALRPGKDHFPYTISKAALVALTKSTALSLAPEIQVNGIALGSILPPADGGAENGIINNVPAKRWAKIEEVQATFQFLLSCPKYITGEIIHVDGGRHLV